MSSENRRPIAARQNRLSQRFAHWLAVKKILTPNQISLLSVLFAAFGALFLCLSAYPAALIAAAVCVQLRLLCNLFDGMVAVEGGMKTPGGELFNEFPDRAADSLFLVALGYGAGLGWLGWLGALLAALTAYIRIFGGSLGLPQSFRGPMAKQHRMALLTAACLLGAWEVAANQSEYVLQAAAGLIAIGSAATCWLRSRDIYRELHRRAAVAPQEAAE